MGDEMIDIEINDDIICFENIKKDDYSMVLEWYNDIDEYKFATGIDVPIKIEKLHKKFREVLISELEFFVGIYMKDSKKCIGVVRGGVNTKFQDSLWINSIIIDKAYQRKGYGSRTIKLIIEFFEVHYNILNAYISVVDKNIKAKCFWENMNFIMFREMNNHLIIDNEKQNVLILKKQLNKLIYSS